MLISLTVTKRPGRAGRKAAAAELLSRMTPLQRATLGALIAEKQYRIAADYAQGLGAPANVVKVLNVRVSHVGERKGVK